uniref:(northern house mosquito) hypothetical protein n=1 Tax=Culex pipiens TaxID=7175 RepID=A0A8D8DVG1_CULPI
MCQLISELAIGRQTLDPRQPHLHRFWPILAPCCREENPSLLVYYRRRREVAAQQNAQLVVGFRRWPRRRTQVTQQLVGRDLQAVHQNRHLAFVRNLGRLEELLQLLLE